MCVHPYLSTPPWPERVMLEGHRGRGNTTRRRYDDAASLGAAEAKCTREAHGRTANTRCLQDSAANPTRLNSWSMPQKTTTTEQSDKRSLRKTPSAARFLLLVTQADKNSYCIPNGKDTRIAIIENLPQLHPIHRLDTRQFAREVRARTIVRL